MDIHQNIAMLSGIVMTNNCYTGVGSRETPDDILILMRRIGYTINVYNTNMYEISWESVNEQKENKESNSELRGKVHGRSTKTNRATRQKAAN